MKRFCLFFVLAFFIIHVNNLAAIDSFDAQFQLRMKKRERFCKDMFQNYSGRNFIIIPQNSESLYLFCMAEFFVSEEEYNTAITYFSEAIKKDNNFIEAYLELSDIYGILGDMDFAILYLYKAISVLQELLKSDIKYLKPYVATYKYYIEAYETKGLKDIAEVERSRLLNELEEVFKTSKEPNITIKRYIDELKSPQ
jgi:tetratricopeptide (TPR) repeat protein